MPRTVRSATTSANSPRRITITPHHNTGWLAVRDRDVLGLVVTERDEAEDFAAWWQDQPIDVAPEDFYIPHEEKRFERSDVERTIRCLDNNGLSAERCSQKLVT